jgi:hypothetical protein
VAVFTLDRSRWFFTGFLWKQDVFGGGEHNEECEAEDEFDCGAGNRYKSEHDVAARNADANQHDAANYGAQAAEGKNDLCQ